MNNHTCRHSQPLTRMALFRRCPRQRPHGQPHLLYPLSETHSSRVCLAIFGYIWLKLATSKSLFSLFDKVRAIWSYYQVPFTCVGLLLLLRSPLLLMALQWTATVEGKSSCRLNNNNNNNRQRKPQNRAQVRVRPFLFGEKDSTGSGAAQLA